MSELPAPRRRVNDRNVVVVVVGAALVVAAMRGLQWYTVEPGTNVAGSGFTFADLHANADGLDAVVSQAYFGWLAATLLVAGGISGLVANVPSPLTNGLRVLAFLLGLLGALGTVYAMAQLFDAQRAAGGSDHAVTHNSSYGFWACLVGFALMMLGGALGPRRV